MYVYNYVDMHIIHSQIFLYLHILIYVAIPARADKIYPFSALFIDN